MADATLAALGVVMAHATIASWDNGYSAAVAGMRGLIAERTSAALKAKAARGEWTGGRPAMGLRQDGDRLVRGDLNALAVVGVIRDLYASGGYSLRAIADALAGAGIPTVRGGRWQPETVRKLIRNPRLTSALERRTRTHG